MKIPDDVLAELEVYLNSNSNATFVKMATAERTAKAFYLKGVEKALEFARSNFTTCTSCGKSAICKDYDIPGITDTIYCCISCYHGKYNTGMAGLFAATQKDKK